MYKFRVVLPIQFAFLLLFFSFSNFNSVAQTNDSPGFNQDDVSGCKDELKLFNSYGSTMSCPQDKMSADSWAKDITKNLKCDEAMKRSCAYKNKFGSAVADANVNAAVNAFKKDAPDSLKSIPNSEVSEAIRKKMKDYGRQYGCSGVHFAGWDSYSKGTASYATVPLNDTSNKNILDKFSKNLFNLGDDPNKWNALDSTTVDVLYEQLSQAETKEQKAQAERPKEPVDPALADQDLISYMQSVWSSDFCKKYKDDRLCIRSMDPNFFFDSLNQSQYSRYVSNSGSSTELASISKMKKQFNNDHSPAYYSQVQQWRKDYVRYRVSPYAKEIENTAQQFSTYDKSKNTSVLDTVTFCSGRKVSEGNKYIKAINPSCGSNLSFAAGDNQDKVSIENFSKDVDFKKCMDKAKADGLAVDKISIISSASRLANTDEAGKKYCAYGFMGLSCSRATSAKDSILKTGIFNDLVPAGQDVSSLITINAKGSNGDGTSGNECPEVMDDRGNITVKSEYAKNGDLRSNLDKNKYVKVNITFKEKTTELSRTVYDYSANATDCKTMKFACNQ